MDHNWDRFVSVVADWKSHAREFGKMVQPSEILRPTLKASGSPATCADLNPAISPDLAHWAVKHCHLMRNRFNLVDLLDMMGLWTEDMIAWAMEGSVSRKAAA